MLSFGLKNAPFCLSKLMNQVLRGVEQYAVPYLDDVAIFSDSWQDHLRHLRDVFSRLRRAGLTLKASKCRLAQSEVLYLGHRVGQGKRRPAQLKAEAFSQATNSSGSPSLFRLNRILQELYSSVLRSSERFDRRASEAGTSECGLGRGQRESFPEAEGRSN